MAGQGVNWLGIKRGGGDGRIDRFLPCGGSWVGPSQSAKSIVGTRLAPVRVGSRVASNIERRRREAGESLVFSV